MQLENMTVATTTDEIREIMRHITLNNFEGKINLTLMGDDIRIWQPDNMPVAESVGNKSQDNE